MVNKNSGLGSIVAWLSWPRAFAVSFAIAVLVAARVYLFVPLQYSASTTVLLSQYPDVMETLGLGAPSGNRISPVRAMMGGQSQDLKRLQTILESRNIISKVADEFDISSTLGFNDEETYEHLRKATNVESIGDFTAQVGLKLKVTWTGRSRFATWSNRPSSYTNDDASQLCAGIANYYIEQLDEHMTEATVRGARTTKEFIQERLDETRSELAQVEDELNNLQTEHAFIEPSDKFQRINAETQALARQYSAARAAAEEWQQSRKSALLSLAATERTHIAARVQARNPLIGELETRRGELRLELDKLLEGGATGSHPDVVELQAQIDGADRQLDSIEQEIIREVTHNTNPVYDMLFQKAVTSEIELAKAKASENVSKKMMEQQEEQLRSLPSTAQTYIQLSRKQAILAQLVSSLRLRLETAMIEEKRVESGAFEVLDRAQAPLKKSAPSTVKTASRIFVIAFVIQSILIAWRDDRPFFKGAGPG